MGRESRRAPNTSTTTDSTSGLPRGCLGCLEGAGERERLAWASSQLAALILAMVVVVAENCRSTLAVATLTNGLMTNLIASR